MKINYVLPGYNRTGGVQTVLEIATRLAGKGHHVSITLPDRPPELRSFKGGVIHTSSWISKKPLSSLVARTLPDGAFHEVRACLLEEIMPECDANIATYWTTAFPVYRSGKGKPFYHMQHFEPMIVSEPRMARIARETYHMPLFKFANSTWLRNMVRDESGIDVPIVNPALDHNTFYPRPVAVNGRRKKVLAFGKEHIWKGIPDLLVAMELVAKTRDDVDLFLYGSRSISHKRNGVPYKFVLGPTNDELAALYSSADVVVCPSWFESFPLPPLEGMACGAPVVTTSIGTEDYALNEETALVVPPHDPKRMAAAILELLGNDELRERLVKAGPRKAKEFSWEKTTDAVDSIIRRVTK